LTPIGTLELWLDSQKSEHRWQLEFQLRSVTGQEDSLQIVNKKREDETFDFNYLKEASQIIENLFKLHSSDKPNLVMEKLENQLGIERKEWSLSILRGLWDSLLKVSEQRKISQEHEARWWNLAGFFLRPGFGFPLDDFRLKELWKVILSDLQNKGSQDILIQKWICFRRIAGGLNKGQQMQIASGLLDSLIDKKSGQLQCNRKNEIYLYSEKIRAFAALERIELKLKTRIGDLLVQRFIRHEEEACDYWSLARIGARHLMYGSVAQVVAKESAEKWIKQLLKIVSKDSVQHLFLLEQLVKKTDHREINVSETIVKELIERFPEVDFTKRLSSNHVLSLNEQNSLFGDQLPPGLILEP
jgi:hypothetical protein